MVCAPISLIDQPKQKKSPGMEEDPGGLCGGKEREERLDQNCTMALSFSPAFSTRALTRSSISP